MSPPTLAGCVLVLRPVPMLFGIPSGGSLENSQMHDEQVRLQHQGWISVIGAPVAGAAAGAFVVPKAGPEGGVKSVAIGGESAFRSATSERGETRGKGDVTGNTKALPVPRQRFVNGLALERLEDAECRVETTSWAWRRRVDIPRRRRRRRPARGRPCLRPVSGRRTRRLRA